MLSLTPVLIALALVQPDADAPHARPALIAESLSATPGETLWLGIRFDIDPGWHTYWPGQNDSGFALDAKLEVSPNAVAAPLQWPAPHRYSPADGILDHVFEKQVTILLPIEVSPEARPGDKVVVRGDLTWLVCEEVCLVESAPVFISVPVAEGSAKPNPDAAAAFGATRKRLPREMKPDDRVRIDSDESLVRFRAIGAGRVAFYPSTDSRRPRDLFAQGEREGELLEVEFRPGEEPIEGVLEIWNPDGTESEVLSLRWPPAESQQEDKPPPPADRIKRSKTLEEARR